MREAVVTEQTSSWEGLQPAFCGWAASEACVDVPPFLNRCSRQNRWSHPSRHPLPLLPHAGLKPAPHHTLLRLRAHLRLRPAALAGPSPAHARSAFRTTTGSTASHAPASEVKGGLGQQTGVGSRGCGQVVGVLSLHPCPYMDHTLAHRPPRPGMCGTAVPHTGKHVLHPTAPGRAPRPQPRLLLLLPSRQGGLRLGNTHTARHSERRRDAAATATKERARAQSFAACVNVCVCQRRRQVSKAARRRPCQGPASIRGGAARHSAVV